MKQLAPRRESLIGRRFGKVVVIEDTDIYIGVFRYWKCQCDCGKIFNRVGPNIKRGKSCGCIHKEYASKANWEGYEQISMAFFNAIYNQAKKRNKIVDLIIEELWELYLKQNKTCPISGIQLYFKPRCSSEKGNISLDRIDPNKNYTIDNVQFVHKDYNELKWDLSEERLYELAKLTLDNKQDTIELLNKIKSLN